MKIKSSKFLLIIFIIWTVLSGYLLLNLWQKNQKLEEINKLLLQGIIASRDFAKNANDAYRTIGECVADYDSCDPKETKDTLLKLDEEKDKINMELQKIDKDLILLKGE